MKQLFSLLALVSARLASKQDAASDISEESRGSTARRCSRRVANRI